MPEVSVITPAFNAARTIERCIVSVADQDFRDWEHLIVDDKSTDETASIACRLGEQDTRIQVLSMEANAGAGPARNMGIQNAGGRYVAFLDADDEWYPAKLSSVLEHMKVHELSFAYHDYDIVDENGTACTTTNAPAHISYNDLLRNTAIGCLTVVIDRSRIDMPEMPAIPLRQPLVAWLRILRTGVVARKVPGVYAAYHRSATSISSNKLKAVAWTWRVYREFEKLPRTESARLLASYAYNALIKNMGFNGRRS